MWLQAAKIKRKQKETFSKRTCEQFGTTSGDDRLANPSDADGGEAGGVGRWRDLRRGAVEGVGGGDWRA